MALIASTIDARPTVFGNKAVITGTFTSTGVTSGHIDLSSHLSAIDSVTIDGVGSTARAACKTGVDGTLIYMDTLISGADYQFMVMGNRS
jgi:hypothetical protein|tara:strand:- start:944 stop:1213 length:270 start_codon:yes stop_codon:yes gene_type:complete